MTVTDNGECNVVSNSSKGWDAVNKTMAILDMVSGISPSDRETLDNYYEQREKEMEHRTDLVENKNDLAMAFVPLVNSPKFQMKIQKKFAFGSGSIMQYNTLHPKLQQILDVAIQIFDFQIVEGYRGEKEQNLAYAKGNSKVKFPNGKHNKTPSLAVDCAPYPIDWSDSQKALERFVFMQGIFYAIACMLGIKIRCGIDWDGDLDMRDEKFRDYPHLELVLDENN